MSAASSTSRKRAAPREFDFERYGEAKIALKMAYFGWPYHGLAVQDDAVETVEGHLFRALTTARLIRDRSSCDFARCGRTDKGVSAFGQVVSLRVRTNAPRNGATTTTAAPRDDMDYAGILNRLLPDNIRVLAWAHVDRAFNARFSCLARTYRYYFWPGRRDLARMREACAHFVGVHDFRNFCKVAKGVTPSFTRHVYSAEIISLRPDADPGELMAVVIVGRAFLWHQIRCMMAVLFAVGDGLEAPTAVRDMLDVNVVTGRPSYEMASELPLVLYDCAFEDVRFVAEADDLLRLDGLLQRLWHERQVVATMTADLMAVVGHQPARQPSGGAEAWSAMRAAGVPAMPRKPYVPLLQRPRERAVADADDGGDGGDGEDGE